MIYEAVATYLCTITITLENTLRSDTLSASSKPHTSSVFWYTESHSLSSSDFLHDSRYSVVATSLGPQRATTYANTIDSGTSIMVTRQVTRATHVRNRICPRVKLIIKIIIILLIIFLGFIKSKSC